MQEMASPIGAFVRQECEVGHGEIDVDTFYGAYKVWAENNGYKAPSKQVLGRDLRAAVPGVRVSQPRDGDVRVRRYVGIKFRDTEK